MNHQKEIEKIKESIKSGALCAINRDVIDTLSIYGFPVEMSDTLAAVAFVYDFMPDGYKIVRTSDITEVFAAEAEQFLERIVKTERPAFVPERTGLALGSMYELCEDLMARDSFVTVECEGYEENIFLIGKIVQVSKKELTLRTFDGMGVWDKECASVPLGDVTCISIGNAYVNILSKYLTE